MAKISGKYEIVYIIDPAQGEEGIAALVEKFKAMVEAEGTLTSIEEWGKRRLAYPINDLPEGYYVLMNCECKPELPVQDHRRYPALHHRRCRSVRGTPHAEPYRSHGPSHP